MKMHIRIKLVIPITLSLLLVPIATWYIFSTASNKFMYGIEEEQLNKLIKEATEYSGKDFLEDSEDPHVNAKESTKLRINTKRVFNHFDNILEHERSSAQFLIINNKTTVVYPEENSVAQSIGQYIYSNYIEEFYAQSIESSSNTKEFSASINGQEYIITMQYITFAYSEVPSIMVGYISINNIDMLLDSAKHLMIIVSLILSLICIVAMWFIIGSIVEPIKKLCVHTTKIGNGNFEKIEGKSSLYEIDQLNKSVNEMVEELKSSDDAQKKFFQNVSHELRTPLMSIGGYAQGIQYGVFEDNAKAAQVILNESKRLTELVNGILTLTRMDSNRQTIALHEICLKDYFNALILRLDGLAIASDVTIRYVNEEELYIMGDDELFDKTFLNIVSNCIRYAKRNVIISATIQNLETVITVSDDGDGLSIDDSKHLFERFYKGNAGNFGIGLAVAKTAAEYMGASIKAYNGENGGAIFELNFKTREPVFTALD